MIHYFMKASVYPTIISVRLCPIQGQIIRNVFVIFLSICRHKYLLVTIIRIPYASLSEWRHSNFIQATAFPLQSIEFALQCRTFLILRRYVKTGVEI
jgi:hypothetical protein